MARKKRGMPGINSCDSTIIYELLLVLKELWALLANVMAYEEAGVCV